MGISNRCSPVWELYQMKGSPCCAGLMRSCLHTYRTITNLTQHIIQPWGGPSAKYGGSSTNYGGPSTNYGGAISQVWGAHQPSMGGVINQLWGAISQVWGGHQPTMGGSSTKYGGPSAKYGGGVFSHQYVQEVKIQRITLATHMSCRL